MHNKFLVFILVITILLLLVGCKPEKHDEELLQATEATAEITITTASESIPGVEEFNFDVVEENTESETSKSLEALEECKTPTRDSTSASEDPVNIGNSGDPDDIDDSRFPTTSTTVGGDSSTSPNGDDKDDNQSEIHTGKPNAGSTDYEVYLEMSGEEQMAYMQSFDTIEAFFVWYNNAKAEYEALHPEIEIGDGIIDAGDLVG